MSSRPTKEDTILVYLRLNQDAAGEQPHVAYANLRDDKAAYVHFVHRWGRPVGVKVSMRGRVEKRDWPNDDLKRAWGGDRASLDRLPKQLHATFGVTGRHIEIVRSNLVSAIVLLFLRDHAACKTAICANPSCPNPYFIRKRKTQKYCEAGPCVDQAQREQKRKWWKRNRGKGVKK
jgi:hypothetical protein